MPSVGELQELRHMVDSLRSRLEQQKGAVRQLKKECKVHSSKEARDRLIELEAERVALEQELTREMGKFRKKYHELFGTPADE